MSRTLLLRLYALRALSAATLAMTLLFALSSGLMQLT
jgi:hypothetical protein